MLSSKRQSRISSPTADTSQGPEAIGMWPRALSGAEMRESGEALANQISEMPASFYIRIVARLDRPGVFQPC